MKKNGLHLEKEHLARLLEAVQRCVFFLDASVRKITWPLTGDFLSSQRTNVELFETLSAINERFSKLQDSLGAAMRHGAILSGETTNMFLKVLAFYEKIGVIESVDSWQLCRTSRNLAAHEYGIVYSEIADHFNTLNELRPTLYSVSRRFYDFCASTLNVQPVESEFSEVFLRVTEQFRENL
ncbi:hypothetical protein [Desulfonatronum thioautotrophicum]|uniref:hypothetical protein n=1 Tax=Desulfonatronum thioautotrophicum TaxID=617001 RepID=UPI0005EB2D9F|nr:hypothetical protein [Desulfonatronum thioautotrophicum]